MAELMRCRTCTSLRICQDEGIIKTAKACNKWQPKWKELGDPLYTAYKILLSMTNSDFIDFKRYWNDVEDIDIKKRGLSKNIKTIVKLIEDDLIDIDKDDYAYMNHFITEASIIRVKLAANTMELDFDKVLTMPINGKKFKVKIISADIDGVSLLSKEGTDFNLTYSTVKEMQQMTHTVK